MVPFSHQWHCLHSFQSNSNILFSLLLLRISSIDFNLTVNRPRRMSSRRVQCHSQYWILPVSLAVHLPIVSQLTVPMVSPLLVRRRMLWQQHKRCSKAHRKPPLVTFSFRILSTIQFFPYYLDFLQIHSTRRVTSVSRPLYSFPRLYYDFIINRHFHCSFLHRNDKFTH